MGAWWRIRWWQLRMILWLALARRNGPPPELRRPVDGDRDSLDCDLWWAELRASALMVASTVLGMVGLFYLGFMLGRGR